MKWLVLLCAVVGLVELGLGEPQAVPPLAVKPEAVPLLPYGQEVVPLLPVAQRLGRSAATSSEAAPLVFVLTLPEGAAVIRSLSRSEWASYQVRAEAWEWIERDMLAAAIVHPTVTASDVAGFSDDLGRTLRRAVNQASGFAVFEVFPESD